MKQAAVRQRAASGEWRAATCNQRAMENEQWKASTRRVRGGERETGRRERGRTAGLARCGCVGWAPARARVAASSGKLEAGERGREVCRRQAPMAGSTMRVRDGERWVLRDACAR